ncbi:uncharacterized protein LAESUDRAFT_759397 [Laetiporus sulphureus 93-53]|uniref:Uncharacterized protein n=1 Tax=Laetiporus sulphureus 93-53 TaxID=1314785 RepID=A0A165EAA2_9APHY|nr:uncharacterized protein LAESUDRAFT_759397 [Laetiporus sulphureus 93-53]KZT06581.1 hypothetical protein LAESUDRAFT_759397 [Laetiporus sulphureus 93-53]
MRYCASPQGAYTYLPHVSPPRATNPVCSADLDDPRNSPCAFRSAFLDSAATTSTLTRAEWPWSSPVAHGVPTRAPAFVPSPRLMNAQIHARSGNASAATQEEGGWAGGLLQTSPPLVPPPSVIYRARNAVDHPSLLALHDDQPPARTFFTNTALLLHHHGMSVPSAAHSLVRSSQLTSARTQARDGDLATVTPQEEDRSLGLRERSPVSSCPLTSPSPPSSANAPPTLEDVPLTLRQSPVSFRLMATHPPHVTFITMRCKRATFFVLHHHLTCAQLYLAGLPHLRPRLCRMTATREREDLCKIRPPVIGGTRGGRRAR